MKIVDKQVLLDSTSGELGTFIQTFVSEIEAAIKVVVWPSGSDIFTIYPEKKANGVTPIKDGCMQYLESVGWVLERRLAIVNGMRPGSIDAVKEFDNGKRFAMEWETGNIASSHRALNKMALAILQGQLMGGILVLPSRAMYKYLTDHVGNYREIKPYIPLWQSIPIEEGYLAIIVIEHDAESMEVPPIVKGTDGRTLR
ncbi:MAG: restriction endonuclease [Kiritimatiellia bacterium]|jgi:hypothetical protein